MRILAQLSAYFAKRIYQEGQGPSQNDDIFAEALASAKFWLRHIPTDSRFIYVARKGGVAKGIPFNIASPRTKPTFTQKI